MTTISQDYHYQLTDDKKKKDVIVKVSIDPDQPYTGSVFSFALKMLHFNEANPEANLGKYVDSQPHINLTAVAPGLSTGSITNLTVYINDKAQAPIMSGKADEDGIEFSADLFFS